MGRDTQLDKVERFVLEGDTCLPPDSRGDNFEKRKCMQKSISEGYTDNTQEEFILCSP